MCGIQILRQLESNQNFRRKERKMNGLDGITSLVELLSGQPATEPIPKQVALHLRSLDRFPNY
jgi:hypothetical protein